MGTILKRILTTVLLFLPLLSFGQGPHQGYRSVSAHGDTSTLDSNRGGQYIHGTVRLAAYGSIDTNDVLAPDANGNVVLRKKGGGSGGLENLSAGGHDV